MQYPSDMYRWVYLSHPFGMIDYELRRRRLAELVGTKSEKDGSKKRFADEIGKSPGQVSHWLSGEKNISEATAKHIEEVKFLPAGWFDRQDDESLESQARRAPRNTPRTMRVMAVLSQLELEGKLDDKGVQWILDSIERAFRK